VDLQPIVCDTGSDEAVTAMASTVAAQLGGADILVNCAAKVNTGRCATRISTSI
jgi:NAD(P)-dependent dehydrogenase (short-subunit alcohol dehydrogenase family)